MSWTGVTPDAGITQGCNPPTNDLYCPNDRVTRGQMAAFLVRALGYTDDGEGNVFTDDDGSVLPMSHLESGSSAFFFPPPEQASAIDSARYENSARIRMRETYSICSMIT